MSIREVGMKKYGDQLIRSESVGEEEVESEERGVGGGKIIFLCLMCKGNSEQIECCF